MKNYILFIILSLLAFSCASAPEDPVATHYTTFVTITNWEGRYNETYEYDYPGTIEIEYVTNGAYPSYTGDHLVFYITNYQVGDFVIFWQLMTQNGTEFWYGESSTDKVYLTPVMSPGVVRYSLDRIAPTTTKIKLVLY
jgi:hypothetical protein